MHPFTETGAAVPAFLAKLWRLVDDPKTDHLICWSKDGRSFIIQNQAQFARELLPLNYKHNNMASFIRQLNMYGFHKITSIDNGGLKFDRDEMEFSHPCFKRGSSYLLEHIKRKIATSKALEEKSNIKTEAVTKVLQDVKAMRGRQESLDSRFHAMKQENQALWREIASLRQKHAKQQQIVNKLIHFLISIVQPSRNMTGVKRHMQLMINDNPQNALNLSESESDCGPIIHELSEGLLDEVASHSSNLIRMGSEHQPESPERPQSSMSTLSNNYDYSNHSAEDAMVNTMSNIETQEMNDINYDAEAFVTSPTSPDFIQTGSTSGGSAQAPTVVCDVTGDSEVDAAINSFNEENHVATPMVRKQMQRTLLLKQRNKQKRKSSSNDSHVSAKQVRTTQPQQQSLLLTQQQRIQQQQQKQQQIQKQQQQQQQKAQISLSVPTSDDKQDLVRNSERIKVKCENNDTNDAMYFLDFENGEADIMCALDDNELTSHNFNANNLINGNSNISISLASTPTPSVMSMPSPSLSSPNTYLLSDDMNQDLFEDSDILSANRGQTIEQIKNNTKNNKNINNFNNMSQQQQQQFDGNFLNSDKFSSFLANNSNNNNNNNSDINGASTSAAAYGSGNGGKRISMPVSNNDHNDNDNTLLLSKLVNEALAQNENDSEEQQNQQQQQTQNQEINQGEQTNNAQNLTLAKYDKNHQGPTDDTQNLEIMRDEVSGQIESVQDELETLKELLRSDGYSLDSSALLGNGGSFQAQSEDLTVTPLDYLTKLFDSDIMHPYGLNNWQPNDGNNKTGSELTTYQPVYDLSDIMDMDKDPKNDSTPSTSQATPSRRLTLNTPIHD